MNTIYDGTFVLGNTSATTYQAGPGISITQPSEGTVRISNDETVLYSGSYSTTTTAINLSEQFTNFDKLEVWWTQQNARPIINHYQTENLKQLFTVHGKAENNQAVVFFAGWNKGNDNKSFTKYYCKYSNSLNWGNFTDANEMIPVKVIGINRISGGNA